MKKKKTLSISEILPHVIQESFNKEVKEQLELPTIINAWKILLGETICTYTTDYSFNNGIFYVKITSAVLRNDLFLERSSLLQKLNQQIGSNKVKSIILR